MKCRLPIALAWMLLSSAATFGQPSEDERVAMFAKKAAEFGDLKFPKEATELSAFSQLAMAIYKPPGDGPFPAIVLVHSCGGLKKGGGGARTELLDWTKAAVEKGYVVFVLDSLEPRGVQEVCGLKPVFGVLRSTMDAYQALQHLQTLPIVDKERIALIGFSWGANVGLQVSSALYARVLSPNARFRAAVSFYPHCYTHAAAQFPLIALMLRPDVDRPLLVLMGEADTESPPSDCVPRLEALLAKGAPVEWHLFPGATHCWDCYSLYYISKRDRWGNTVEYRYNKETTEESARRTFEFLGKQLDAKR